MTSFDTNDLSLDKNSKDQVNKDRGTKRKLSEEGDGGCKVFITSNTLGQNEDKDEDEEDGEI